MPALHLKLAGSLLVGGMCAVAGLVTLTSTTSAQVTPSGDSNATAPQQQAEQTAPCPAGTVERPDACVKKVVKVVPAPAMPAAPPAPVSRPASVPQVTRVATTQPAPPEPVRATETEHATPTEPPHVEDSQEPEHQDEHEGETDH
ncbi:MAG: hypothetical protein WCD35_01500 [Mycobacteriales bacterium]